LSRCQMLVVAVLVLISSLKFVSFSVKIGFIPGNYFLLSFYLQKINSFIPLTNIVA
jgi:hypothetical protein